jgi:HPt (histidine-containing phosphotransfer) domain-containing protein
MTRDESLIYSSFGGDPDLAELVEIFVSEIPERVSAIESALREDDFEAVRRLAHQLKGAAGSYGFDSLTPAAAAIESRAGGDASPEAIREAVRDLESLCRRLRPGVAR